MSAFLKACFIGMVLLLVAPAAMSAAGDKPAFPTAHKKSATHKLKYDDLDLFLKQTVLLTGRSDHKVARKPAAITGTRVAYDNTKPSRLEGNRVLFHQQTEELARVSGALRDTMLDIASKVNFAKLSKDEQLAFWLNLHNIIVYHELAARYPVTDLEPLVASCSDQTSIYCNQSYNLAGQMVSLNDIRDHIVANWDDPLVIYGFYLGAVGTPNVRGGAFDASNVWQALHENAVDFIHSVRGSRKKSGKSLSVSEYYQFFPKFFPRFEADILAHIREFAEDDYLQRLGKIKKVKANLNDWNIADLYNGHLKDPTGAGNVVRNDPRSRKRNDAVPLHARRLLADIQRRNKTRDEKMAASGSVKTNGGSTTKESRDISGR